MNTNKNTLSIAVMSGKGGVGKTNISLNLAFALHSLGNAVMLMDCDLGLANLDVLLGVTPDKNLEDLLSPKVKPEEILVCLNDPDLHFLPAATGVPELANWDSDIQSMLLGKLNSLFNSYDYLLMDLGAGINNTVTTLAAMTHLKCVVITSEPTSLTDGYALIKVMSTQRKIKNFLVIVNMVKTIKDGEQAFNRLKTACERFLGIQLSLLGIIVQDEAVTRAVLAQTPLYQHNPQSRAYKGIKKVADKINQIKQTLSSPSTSALNINILIQDRP